MKRDWDVIRKIMIRLEAVPTERGQLGSSDIEGVDNERAFYHMRMMIESGLAVGGCPEVIGDCYGYLTRLTWDGHELLDQIRRDSIWNKIKAVARSKSLDLSADVVKRIARQVIEGLLA